MTPKTVKTVQVTSGLIAIAAIIVMIVGQNTDRPSLVSAGLYPALLGTTGLFTVGLFQKKMTEPANSKKH